MAYHGNAPADVALVVGQDVITTTEIQDATIATADIASDAITATKVDDDGTGFQMGSLGLGTAVSGSHKLTVGGTATFSGDITGTLATASQPNITSVGTIGTGVWDASVIASDKLDADTAHLSEAQTFSGAKTFSDDVTLLGASSYARDLTFAHGASNYYWRMGYTDTSNGNTLAFINRDGGSEQEVMRMDWNKRVGIGRTPTKILDITQTQNADSSIRLTNSDLGSASSSTLNLTNGTDGAYLTLHGTGFTTSGVARQSGTFLNHYNGAGGLTLNTQASAPIYLATNNTTALTIDTSQNATFEGEISSYGGIQTKGTNGNNPTGDWYDVHQKFLTYKHDVTSTHVTDGYFSVSHGISRGNILGVIPHHYGYGGTNVNNFGITSGFVENVIMYANATLRVYIGSSVVASDKIYLTMIVEGNTG